MQPYAMRRLLRHPAGLFERRRRVQDARRTTRTHCRRAVCRSSNLLNIAEQPARLGLGDGALLTEWKSAYKRGVAMQAPLALVGSLLEKHGSLTYRGVGGALIYRLAPGGCSSASR